MNKITMICDYGSFDDSIVKQAFERAIEVKETTTITSKNGNYRLEIKVGRKNKTAKLTNI